jgi:ABC-type arginine/histidine transport system permease subunit
VIASFLHFPVDIRCSYFAFMSGLKRVATGLTYAPYEIFISLAIVYMIITLFIQKLMARIERWLGRSTVRTGQT